VIRVGVIGAGIRGSLFTRSLKEHPLATVRAVCDLSSELAQRLANDFDLAAYTDFRVMLEEVELDAVIVATPDFAHRDAVIESATRGLHVLVEKPFATTNDDAYAMRGAVSSAGVHCMVGFENRWNPAFLRVHELAAKGELGQVITQNILLSNSLFVPTRMLSWSGKSSPAWFLMSHTADLAMWISGSAPASVVARGSSGILANLGIDTWDVAHALLTFEDGTTANLTSSWVLPDSMPSIVDFQYQAVGNKAAAFVDLHAASVRVAGRQYGWQLPLGGPIDGQLQGPPTWMVQSFVTRLAAGEPLSPTSDDGVRATEVVSAIHESLESGRAVVLNTHRGT
jgi:predicted dehydrogenase